MNSYLGNTASIDIDEYKGFRAVNPHFFSPVDTKNAQSVLDKNDATKEQMYDLCNRIFKSDIKSTVTGGHHLDNAVIIEWDSEIKTPLADLRRVLFMSKFKGWKDASLHLSDWQTMLIEMLIDHKCTKQIIAFKESEVEVIWTIIEESSVQKTLEYNQLFFNVLEKYPEIDCDFMVYDYKELANISIPKQCLTINV